MPRLLDTLDSAGPCFLALDDTEYAGRLLEGGEIPWLDADRWVAFRRKASSLLRSDLALVPFAGFARAWVGAHPELRDAMAAKKRAIAPARTLLGDEDLARHVTSIARALRAALPRPPLVLSLPSPRAWVHVAYALAFGTDATVEVGEDEADACAVHLADRLRSFADAGVDAVLLEELATAEPASAAEVAWYQPVLNVAAHYRWEVGLRMPTASRFQGRADGVAFAVAPRPLDGPRAGLTLPSTFWDGTEAPSAPAGGFRFVEVPVAAVPETVLARLATLL